ncbi:MAG TPA: hypothetical protein VLJ59_03170, partial [Mycobacteriales bacterium]|nr:hypothetical protein [Mycobacteriales bacterium]
MGGYAGADRRGDPAGAPDAAVVAVTGEQLPERERPAFGEFYRDTVHRALARASMLTDRTSVEDLVQDAYVLAARRWVAVLRDLQPGQRMRWMRTCVVRLAGDRGRTDRQFQQYAPTLYEPGQSRAPDPEDAALSALSADICPELAPVTGAFEEIEERLASGFRNSYDVERGLAGVLRHTTVAPRVRAASRRDPVKERAYSIGVLLKQASDGDQRAWDELVGRYTNLLWSVSRSFRLDAADAADA